MKVMKSKHTQAFLISIVIYSLFILRGFSSDHYQGLTTDFIFVDCLDIFIFLIPTCFLILKFISRKQDYFKDSIWLAFYFTVPFFIFDSIFLGIIKGFGFNFFTKWWFLSLFYFILWIEFPIIGYLMKSDDPKKEKKHFLMITISVVCCLINYWEGLYSNHYIDWNLDMKIMRLMNIPLVLLPITYFFLRHCSQKVFYLKDACFLAFYMSFIFSLFDFHYLAIVKNHGVNYLLNYWFVTLFYPVFWIIIPSTGWAMQKFITNQHATT